MTDTLDILERLIGAPTVSADSNLALIAYVDDFLTARGFETHRIAAPCATKAGILASLGPRDAPGVMLSGHTDVVPVEGQAWTKPPFQMTRVGDRVYGRGTTDMKGFLACMLSAADRAAGMALTAPLKLAFSWDEEIGCLGIPHMLPHLDRTIGAPALCIVGEPTSMRIATGHKGKAALRATCHGAAGHSSMAPEFLNAIHLACDVVGGLRGLQDDLRRDGAKDGAYDIAFTTVHVGKIAGGTALNIVPDKATVDFEYRFPAVQPEAAIKAAIEALRRGVEARWRKDFPQARVTLETIFSYPGLGVAEDAPSALLLKTFVPGAAFTKVGYGTEAGHFAAAGIPALVCGPGSMDQGHKPDEFIDLSELAACDAMCDRMLAHLRG